MAECAGKKVMADSGNRCDQACIWCGRTEAWRYVCQNHDEDIVTGLMLQFWRCEFTGFAAFLPSGDIIS